MNWIIELKKAIEKEPTKEKWEELTDLARGWPTCACGQLCKQLPRDYMGAPKDWPLLELGGRFVQCVADLKWRQALSTFHAIEARTAELLAEQGKEA